MTETEKRALPYRTRFVFGSGWPALVGFLVAVGYMFVHMYASGYFGNPTYEMYEGGPRGWIMIMFPIMIGFLVALSALGINAIIFAVIRPTSKRTIFLIGLLALPAAVLAGIGIKSLL